MEGLGRSCCLVTVSQVSGNFLKISAAIFVCPRPSEYSMLTTGTSKKKKVVDKLYICTVGSVHFWRRIDPKKLRILQEMVQSFHEIKS
jgi:hypothetical protein